MLKKVFIADTDKENIHELTCMLKENQNIQPAIWQDLQSFKDSIDASQIGVLFIRIDDPTIPGLELTRLAAQYYPKIHTVWMAESKSYALEAFPMGVTAFIMLPATAEKLQNAQNIIDCCR